MGMQVHEPGSGGRAVIARAGPDEESTGTLGTKPKEVSPCVHNAPRVLGALQDPSFKVGRKGGACFPKAASGLV